MTTKLGKNKLERQINFFDRYLGIRFDKNGETNNYLTVEETADTTYGVAIDSANEYNGQYGLCLKVQGDNMDKPVFISFGQYTKVTTEFGGVQHVYWIITVKSKADVVKAMFSELAKGCDDIFMINKGTKIHKN